MYLVVLEYLYLLADSTLERKVTLPTERNRVFRVSVDIYFSSLLFSTRIFEGEIINQNIEYIYFVFLHGAVHVWATPLEILDNGVYRK